jgi:hypothetical protein
MANVIGFDVQSRIGGREAELLDHPHTRLIGATLRWKRYRGWTAPRVSGRCDLCEAGFNEGGAPGLTSGYSVLGGGPAGQDDYVWICAVCYEMGRDRFCWTVLDTRDEATEPPDLLDSAFGLMPLPVDDDGDGTGSGWRDVAIAPLPRR